MMKSTLLATAVLLPLASTAHADEVEIYLADMLDNVQVGYCLDIAKAQEYNADPADGLQGHTCYSNLGALGVDQTFETDRFGEGVLYMPKFDVCASIASTDAGTAIDLATCDGSNAQSFAFSGEGTITPTAAPEMCLTLATATRTGRSDANQIKVLSLETCDADLAAYQEWAVRGLSD